MAKKKDLCRNSNGLFVRNLGWKQTPSGYSQHKFYLGRDESKAKVASVRLEQLWDQVCLRWQRQYGDDLARRRSSPAALVEYLPATTILDPGQTHGLGELLSTQSALSAPDDDGMAIGSIVIRGLLEPAPLGPDRPVWETVTLAIAEAIRDALPVARVPPPANPAEDSPLAHSVADWLDALRQDFPGIKIEIADPQVNQEAEDGLERDARRLIDAGRQKLVRRAGGETLHAAMTAYARWIDSKYLTVDRQRTAWGGTQARQVEFIRQHIKAIPLAELDARRIEEQVDVLRLRPKGADGKPVSVSFTRNCLKQFRHFLRWLNVAPEFDWKLPAGLDLSRVRVPITPEEKSAAARSARVETYTLDELRPLWEYATPFQRVLLLLGLNCGFGRAEVASLGIDELLLRQPHPHAADLGHSSGPGDSWVLRVRHKSGVYGEWKLWPETVAAVDWWLRQRAALPVATGVTTLLVTKKGNRYDAPTKANHTNCQIPNVWLALTRQIRKDHLGFRQLSFNKLRKTAGNLIRQAAGGEVAGVFLCHGAAVPADRLLDLYTNRPFARVFEAIDRVGEKLRSLWAGVADPFPEARPMGGPNISRAKIRRIQELKRQGYRTDYIARKLEVTEETVRRWGRRKTQ
jgi:hypothetical protein